jgi:diguanylate cyclase (GGDEF)-like protein
VKSVIHRSTDLVSRYGGEEFAVILPHTDMAGVHKIATEIIQSIANLRIPHGGSAVSDVVTVSIGITSLIPNESGNPELIVRQADQALYMAKRQGRNCIVSYGGE